MARKIVNEELKTVEHRKKRHAPPPPKYQPNLTPLIDVLFLLLLFFLLGTKFRQEEGQIPSSLPQLGSSAQRALESALPPQVRLSVDPQGAANENATYTLAGSALPILTPDDLYKKLAALRETYGPAADDTPVIINARGDVRWEYVVEAFNQAARAKFKNIAFGSGG